jgi:hypothetical protein
MAFQHRVIIVKNIPLEVDIQRIAGQVQENCDISDAKYWGIYSLCGLLLRLRDMYKWEKGIEPWGRVDTQDLMGWIDERERRWKGLVGREFRNIEIGEKEFDSFDTRGVNRVLNPRGFLYGAGYVRALKPSFFLAELQESREERGFNIYLLGREHARDISAAPALTRGREIFARREMMRFFLWDRVEEFKTSGKKALEYALEEYGLRIGKNEEIGKRIDNIADEELETFLHHEMGEASDSVFPDEEWREVIVSFPHSKIERLARVVRDILADTNEGGTLSHIIENEKKGSLGFYVSSITGLRKLIFPEIIPAFWNFSREGSWDIIEEARRKGFKTAKGYAERFLEIKSRGESRGLEWTREKMEKELIAPLGI